MNVVGIDYSSHNVDIVWLHLDDQHSPLWFRYPLEGTDAFERTRNVTQALPGAHSGYWDDVLAVGIEHPAGKFGTGPLMRIQGAILACLPPRMLVEPLPPAKWRKLTGLAGNCTKEIVFWESRSRLGPKPPVWPQDAHDAHLIALATRTLLEREKAA